MSLEHYQVRIRNADNRANRAIADGLTKDNAQGDIYIFITMGKV